MPPHNSRPQRIAGTTEPPFSLPVLDSVDPAQGHDAPADLKSTRRVRPRKDSGPASRVDRLPPNAPDAERGVLGCLLLSPGDTIGECLRLLRPGSEAFYDLRHQTIFDTLVKMYDSRQP